MRRIIFYLGYGWSNIWRGGRWAALAIFCIAAGVAAIVALRGLGLAIGEALVDRVRIEIRGDVRLIKDRDGESRMALLMGSEEVHFFSTEELTGIRAYVSNRGGRMAEYMTGGGIQIAGIDSGGIFSASQFINTYLINPQTYPPTHTIMAIEPAGLSLGDLLTGGPQIVISQNMAETQNIALGDTVRIARTEQPFQVVGIVSAAEESSLRNLFAAFFGFAYIDLEAAQQYIDPALGPNNIAIAFDDPLTTENVETVRRELVALGRVTTRFIDSDTALAVLERNQAISQMLGDFIVVMGLGALLIGGVGIMNTMLVLVRRRTEEIAALKTFGLKGGQIGMLFLAEGLLLGLMGSILGCVLGVLLGGIVNQYGEVFIKQELAWRIYPEALAYGIGLGMVITMIFSIAPIQTALQIRPAIILRPNENHAPRLGVLRSLALMIIVTVLIGLVVGRIVTPTFGLVSSFNFATPYLAGIISVAVTLLILGLLTALLWVVVWLVGKIPTFGSVDLRLALRNLSSHRWRTATTLLALSAGMFALSSITFVGQGTRELLNLQLSKQFGGNVLAFPISPPSRTVYNVVKTVLNNALADVPGVDHRTTLAIYDVSLAAVDGEALTSINQASDPDEAAGLWGSFGVWDSSDPDIYEGAFGIVAGRNLTPEDRGSHVMLASVDGASALGVQPGNILTFNVNGARIDYELVGLYRTSNGLGGGTPVVPPDTTNNLSPQFMIFAFRVQKLYVGQAVAELSAVRIPPTLALDIGFIDSLIQRLIEQFASLPTIVGLLSLLAAAVIMANTVALATLERRRQIGILKSIGLKSWRVLLIMLIESSIVGLLSALLGIGLSWIFIALMSWYTSTPLPLPQEARWVAAGLVIAAVAISAASTFLSANVATRERVMNVLRYE